MSERPYQVAIDRRDEIAIYRTADGELLSAVYNPRLGHYLQTEDGKKSIGYETRYAALAAWMDGNIEWSERK